MLGNILAYTTLSNDQLAYLNRHPIGVSVGVALSQLLQNDHDLLIIDANERSITFRFAMYLQLLVPEWVVDCEFNRDGIDPKRLGHLDLDPDSEDIQAKTVYPDVIVHKRGTTENYLVLEFKKSTSHVDRRIDLQKLHGYKKQLGYMFALFVEAATDGKAGVTTLEWV